MAGTHHLLPLHLLNITDISQILIRTHFIIIIFITHNSSENTGQRGGGEVGEVEDLNYY